MQDYHNAKVIIIDECRAPGLLKRGPSGAAPALMPGPAANDAMAIMHPVFRFLRLLSACLVALVALAVTPARAADVAAASPWARNDHAAVRLIAGQDRVGKDGRVRLGLEFELAPGWHIYWRAPGDAGVPPRVDWARSKNLAGAETRWPLPKRFTIFGLTTFVYGGHVVLPIDAHVTDRTGGLALDGHLSYLACEKICIPYEAELSLDVPAAGGDAQPTAFAARIAAFATRVPPRIDGRVDSSPLAVTHAALVRGRDGLSLEVLARADRPFGNPEVLVEGPSTLRFGAPVVERGKDTRMALIRLPVTVAGEARAVPEHPQLIVTLADGGRAVSQAVTADSSAAAEAGIGLAAILAIAFLGGLVLNLMPCVLPVLSLKLLAVMGHGGGEAPLVRRGFLATSAGIVASFWLLAGAAVALKGAGAAVGWGIQFQSPAFLAVMAVVVTLFAANLFGFFEIPLPGFAGRIASRAPEDRGSLIGAFATGVFATLLATPCSAPFLGTALGFALTRGAADIFAVFTMLGLGLAAPYLLVAALPGLAVRLPRPGAWMARLRVVLGVALALTALWLVSVLWAVSGPRGALGAGMALALLLAVLGARTRIAALHGAGGLAAVVLATVLAVAAPVIGYGDATVVAQRDSIPWHPFDKVDLYNRVAQGQLVFVDVTAQWCVTCKANKALVIERGKVAAALRSGRVVPMMADWTRPDPKISAYLSSFGRYGIPFNAVYGPGAPRGIALPEILTQSVILAAVERASGRRAAARAQ